MGILVGTQVGAFVSRFCGGEFRFRLLCVTPLALSETSTAAPQLFALPTA